MARSTRLALPLLICTLLLASCVDQTTRKIQTSHIEGNAPKAADFELMLQRDLTSYFETIHGEEVAVQYEFLRQGPTQSGVSYPKYYLWAKVTRAGSVIDEGAIRCAAVETTHFEVTDFITKTSLQKDLTQAASVFPAGVCERISEKIKH